MPELQPNKICFPIDNERWIVLKKLGKKVKIMAYNIEKRQRDVGRGDHRMDFAEAEGGVRIAPKLVLGYINV